MLVSIDIGTTGGKAALFSEDLEMLAHSRRDYPTHLDDAGIRAEHDPEDWWRWMRESVPDLLAQTGARGSEIRAVGLSCMTPVLLPIDEGSEPLTWAQLWYDRRAAGMVPELNRLLGPGAFERITGSNLSSIRP